MNFNLTAVDDEASRRLTSSLTGSLTGYLIYDIDNVMVRRKGSGGIEKVSTKKALLFYSGGAVWMKQILNISRRD